MAEVLFYHLQAQPLDEVLPGLLERSLGRGWRVAVQSGVGDKLSDLDTLLWSYRDDSFLPHGTSGDEFSDQQPILLMVEPDNRNAADVRFLIHDAALPDDLSYERVVLMFDGTDEIAVGNARQHWKTLKTGDHDLTYWQQNDAGRWEKKA
ncbi:MAG: DNA polymerase III subunit chi [Hyphomicrobiales bacterium]